jgi:hypothetical protein
MPDMNLRERPLLCMGLGLLVSTAACGDNAPAEPGPPDGAIDPMPDAPVDTLVFRHELDLADGPLALEALRRLGAPVGGEDTRCQSCHSTTNAQLRAWIDNSLLSYSSCLTDVDPRSPDDATATLDCLRNLEFGKGDTVYARHLDLWATAARLPWFTALATSAGLAPEDFAGTAAMPPAGVDPLTQAEFDVVAEWILRGAPQLDELVPPEVGPTTCEPFIDPAVSTRIAALATTGWQQRNADADLAMFGCAGAATTLECLSDEPLASSKPYASTWDVGAAQIRILAEMPAYSSSFWTRSSADGRFVAHGGGDGAGGSTIIDLSGDHHIGVDAAFDPTFFPDNSGFIFQGNEHNACAQSILLGAPGSISMSTDPACAGVDVGLYQHVGRALDQGEEYFATHGNFVSDSGSFQDGPAFFGGADTVAITSMAFDGTSYLTTSTSNFAVPFEGDVAVSTSTKFLLSRQGDPDGNHIALVLRALDATLDGDHYDISAPVVARYCGSGGKPGFSYDDRYVVYHHGIVLTSDEEAQELGFDDVNDPKFQAYVDAGGAQNIWLLDLTTGVRTRITNMKPGQLALFPHFRSDGWIYFLVKDLRSETPNEYVAASNARLLLAD